MPRFLWTSSNSGPRSADNNIEEDDYGEAVYTVDLEEAHNGAEGASYDNYTDDINIEALAVIGSDVDYAELYFEDTMFWYSVKNSSKTTVNVYYETSNKTMATTYEDADLEMIFFPGAPEFDYTGILHAPADEDAYVYAVIDGKLVSDKFDWDEDSECWEYSTRAIEGVVVSDIALDVSLYNATVDNSSDPSASSDTGQRQSRYRCCRLCQYGRCVRYCVSGRRWCSSAETLKIPVPLSGRTLPVADRQCFSS